MWQSDRAVFLPSVIGIVLTVALTAGSVATSRAGSSTRPHPVRTTGEKRTAILAGGCFWGVEAVYEHVRGVKSVKSGFAVPTPSPATGEPTMRAAGKGYAEAVRVVYDPAEVSYEQLLEIFFTVAHDPTQLDRQGPDVGPEYRSAIFVQSEEERQSAQRYLDQLRAAGSSGAPIVTEVVGLKSFRDAAEAHQDYVVRHPTDPYVVVNDRPKITALQQRFPALYRDQRAP